MACVVCVSSHHLSRLVISMQVRLIWRNWIKINQFENNSLMCIYLWHGMNEQALLHKKCWFNDRDTAIREPRGSAAQRRVIFRKPAHFVCSHRVNNPASILNDRPSIVLSVDKCIWAREKTTNPHTLTSLTLAWWCATLIWRARNTFRGSACRSTTLDISYLYFIHQN